MDIKRTIGELKTLLPADFKMVSSLYALSERSLIILLFLSVFITYFLYPTLGTTVVLWNALFLLFITMRLFCAYTFKKNIEKYTLKIWYRIFAISAFSTAFFFVVLSFMMIPYSEHIQAQLLLTMVLVGLASASNAALHSDVRIEIIYVTIIMIAAVTSLLLQGKYLYQITALFVSLHYLALVSMSIQRYRQHKKILEQEDSLEKVNKTLYEKQNLLHQFVNEAPLAIFTYNTDLHIIDSNNTLYKLFKTTKEKIIGLDLKSLPDSSILNTMKKALNEGSQIYTGPYRSITELDLWLKVTCFSFNDKDGKVSGGIGIIDDKTKEYQAIKELEYFAGHDQLTELLNRRGLEIYMKKMIEDKKHKSFYSLLFYLDLNKFKHINDSLGHKIGDELLVSISKRLETFISDNAILSRFGGDEFIIILPYITNKKIAIEKKINQAMKEIQKVFLAPFAIQNMNLSINTSIGIVIIEPHDSNIEEIIRHADIAMYQAKKSTNNSTSYYKTQLDKERKELFLLQHDLAHAIRSEEFLFYLQPLVPISNHKVVAAESLIRWQHPVRGLLFPQTFIPIAIETGLIFDITWWLIEKVCQYIAKLKEEGMWHLDYISVNIDAKQLLLNQFADEFLNKLNKYALDSGDIMLEITEQSLIDNFEETQDVIDQLRKEGIHCAIDDFGIGYSSFSYLKKLSFDTLKIDREFVKNIESRPDDIILIKSMIAIGRQFNYNIVVEGIEEIEEKNLLIEIDNTLIYQGYLFSRPIPHDDFTKKYLKN